MSRFRTSAGGGGGGGDWMVVVLETCHISQHLLFSSMAAYSITLSDIDILCYKDTIFKKCRPEADCLLWQGKTDTKGYGVFAPTIEGKRYTLKVHRFMYYLYTGCKTPLSPDKHVSHRCHNKLCVMAGHLSYEEAGVNNQRQPCRDDGACCGHLNHDDCLV